MHASIEQLLEIRDGVDSAASAHVYGCERCRAELAALDHFSDELFEFANQTPRIEVWQRIEQTVGANTDGIARAAGLISAQSTAQFAHQRSLSHAIYTLAASILVTGFIGLYLFNQNVNNQTQTELLHANIQQLMINSRGMEQALQKVSLQSELLSAAERSEVDRLYWQLAYLDQQIHDQSSVDSHNDPQRVEVLWNSRIQALRELNQLYYQRQQVLDDSEI